MKTLARVVIDNRSYQYTNWLNEIIINSECDMQVITIALPQKKYLYFLLPMNSFLFRILKYALHSV